MGGDTMSRREVIRRIAFFDEHGDAEEVDKYRAILTKRREGARVRQTKHRNSMPPEAKAREKAMFESYRERNNEDIKARARARLTTNKLRAMHLLGDVCADCNKAFPPAAMDFHHKDPSKKLFNLAGAKMACKWESVVEEVNKCILLCANCHRVRHASPL